MTGGGKTGTKTPPTPPAPFQVVEILTVHVAPAGVTVNVVTKLESWSDSVITRPGSGSATRIVIVRVRPPALTLKRCSVPAPTPPSSTSKSENESGRKR